MDNETLKHIGDGAAASLALVTIVKWLPPIAALFTIVWTGLRIWDWIESRLTKKRLDAKD